MYDKLSAKPTGYIDELIDPQYARTFVPTAPMVAIAATTISPAIRAYSKTSPPRSSTIKCLMFRMPSRSALQRAAIMRSVV